MDATLGNALSLWLVLPFAGLLLCIALLPLAARRWFDDDRNKVIVAAAFGVPVVVYLLVGQGAAGREQVLDTAHEYVSFIVLLAALYTIAGGIFLSGNILATPRSNLVFLLVGALLANVIGTTGAALVLVFPLLRANSERCHTRHIPVFLIFVVCNTAGLLLPLGPPLFLGFLQGVDFFWTLRLLPQWALVNGILLLVFYLVDRHEYAKETSDCLAEDVADYVPLGLEGKINLLFLAGVVATVVASGLLAGAAEAIHFAFLREVIIIVLLLLSLKIGPHTPREHNGFSWHPIREVAILFAGIFAAIAPVLAILQARGGDLGLTQPWEYLWASGGLSSVLDNTPAYLAFTAAAQGYLGVDSTGGLMATRVLPAVGNSPAEFLAAISCGTVFMGALTYVGNAPNFMVRSIAERSGIDMPHFFHFTAWAAAVLLPVFALVTVVFFL
jgi:Na+/H+ antiporter NhaD/arsenite permease-like protein